MPKTARAQRGEVFQSFRREVANPALSETHRLLMLRTAATTHFWSAAQVRQLVSLIAYQQRVDAAVMLFKRTVDQQNFAEQVYRLLKPSERGGLRGRLGEALTPLLSADDLAEAKIEVDASRRRASVDPRTSPSSRRPTSASRRSSSSPRRSPPPPPPRTAAARRRRGRRRRRRRADGRGCRRHRRRRRGGRGGARGGACGGGRGGARGGARWSPRQPAAEPAAPEAPEAAAPAGPAAGAGHGRSGGWEAARRRRRRLHEVEYDTVGKDLV